MLWRLAAAARLSSMRRGRAILIIVVAAALLGALYPVIRALHGQQESGAGYANSFRLAIAKPDPNAPPRAYDARTIDDFPIFKARQGETLSLTIHSERAGTIHIHGYEKHVELVPNGDVSVSFEAKDAGLFPVHLHGADDAMEHVATFEIQPK